MTAIYLYALCDADETIRYIGASANPKKRLREHYSRPYSANYAMSRWLRTIKRTEITMLILGVYDETTIVDAEQEEIARQRARLGSILLNDPVYSSRYRYQSTLRP